MIKIQYSKLRAAALILLLLPTFVFIVTWLKLGFAFLGAQLLAVALFFVLKTKDDRELEFKISTLVILAVGVAVWVYLAGQGGFFSQKGDHFYRNVIFRDLVNYDWPVRYHNEADESLVYYIGYWLVPALFGKIFTAMAGFNAGWLAARIVLFIWSFLFIYTSILLVCFKLGSGKRKAMFVVLVVFVFFSGMDVLGIRNTDITNHIEWWSFNMQFSSMTTQLFWVFNQAVPAWLATALTLNEKDERAYALIGLGLLSTSPLPLVGLAVYMLYKAAIEFNNYAKKKEIAKYIKRVATIPNILAVVTILPVYSLYYRNNVASEGSFKFIGDHITSDPKVAIPAYIAFLLVEFAFLLILITNKKNKNDAIYAFAFLAFAPLARIGTEFDFCMRASIPALFIIMVMLIEYFYDVLENKEKRVHLQSLCLVVVFFLVGAVTPMVEISNNVRRYVETEGESAKQLDVLETLMDSTFEGRINFVCVDSANTFFYKYIAKADT